LEYQSRLTPTATVSDEDKPKARFVDVADMRGLGQIALPFVGWGTEFVDLDKDDWLVGNRSTLEAAGPAPRQPRSRHFRHCR